MAQEIGPLPLIRSRLQRPRLPGDLIPRCRLLDRLHAGSNRKLTLISAQAGSRKTTLLSQWLDECPGPSACLSLDFDDANRVIGVELEDASKYINLTRLELWSVPIADLIVRERVPATV